jgi:hypothetical protein
MLQPAALLSMPRIPHVRAANLLPVHGVPRWIKPAPRWVGLLSLHTMPLMTDVSCKSVAGSRDVRVT